MFKAIIIIYIQLTYLLFFLNVINVVYHTRITMINNLKEKNSSKQNKYVMKSVHWNV